MKRYKTYAYLLRSRLSFGEVESSSLAVSSIGEVDETGGLGGPLVNVAATEMGGGGGGVGGIGGSLMPPPVPERLNANRYSYRAAIYSRNLLNGQQQQQQEQHASSDIG